MFAAAVIGWVEYRRYIVGTRKNINRIFHEAYGNKVIVFTGQE